MPTIEFARAEDCAELLDYLVAVFRRDRPDHPRFETLYPELFFPTDESMGLHAIVREGGRIASCVGAYPMTLQVAGCRVPICGIGQVSTREDCLGRGYMSALLKAQLARMREQGVALAWLGGRHDRYAHFGFETAGLQFVYGLDRRSLVRYAPTRAIAHVAATAPDSITDAMFRLRERTVDSVLEPLDCYRRRLAKGGGMEIWTATPSGATEPDAWALIATENRAIEEWCGSPEGRMDIAAAAVEALGSLRCTEIPANQQLSELLRDHCSWMGTGVSSFCILNRDRLLEAYRPVISDAAPLPQGEDFSRRLVRLCFGPEPSAFAPLPFLLPGPFHV